MKGTITMIKGYVDDLTHLLMSFFRSIGVLSVKYYSVVVCSDINVIGNLTSIIGEFSPIRICWS